MANQPIPTRSPFTRAYVAIVASMLALTLGSFIYSNYAASRSAQKWCAVVGTLNSAYQSQPPTTSLGRLLAQQMNALYRSLDCPAQTGRP